MKWRILGSALGSVSFALSLVAFVLVGGLALKLVGLLSSPTIILVLGASIVGSILVFRAVHDWAVLRWSNETDPFVYGERPFWRGILS